jgi:outer membrane protein assembly factor BamB
MTVDQLVFVGFRGYAMALDRDTGEVVWCNSEMRSGYVSMLLDGDRLIVSTNGYMYCLNPLTGTILWHNPLTGYGTGVAHLVSVRGQSSQSVLTEAAEEEASASAAATSASTTAS